MDKMIIIPTVRTLNVLHFVNITLIQTFNTQFISKYVIAVKYTLKFYNESKT